MKDPTRLNKMPCATTKIWCSQINKCVLSHFSYVWLFAILWALAQPAPLSMRFSQQEYSGGLPFPSPGYLPKPGIEPTSLLSPALSVSFLTTSATWEILNKWINIKKIEGRRRGWQKMRWLDGITNSWTWTWANSRRWWRTVSQTWLSDSTTTTKINNFI